MIKESVWKTRFGNTSPCSSFCARSRKKNQEVMQQAYLEHNTAKLNLERVLLQKQESGKAAASLAAETKEIEQQKQQIGEECSKIAAQLKELADKESRIKEQTQTAQKELEEHLKSEQEYTKGLSEIQDGRGGVKAAGRICPGKYQAYR